MRITPCIDCNDRRENCHAECDNYKSWRSELNEIKKVITDKKIKEAEVHRRQQDGIRRMRNSKKGR